MRTRLFTVIGIVLVIAAVAVYVMTGNDVAGSAPQTPWGDPDLQGLWSYDLEVPLQRPARYADKEFFTEEERSALDRERAGVLAEEANGRAEGPRGAGAGIPPA